MTENMIEDVNEGEDESQDMVKKFFQKLDQGTDDYLKKEKVLSVEEIP
jgi:hypothetical protein